MKRKIIIQRGEDPDYFMHELDGIVKLENVVRVQLK